MIQFIQTTWFSQRNVLAGAGIAIAVLSFGYFVFLRGRSLRKGILGFWSGGSLIDSIASKLTKLDQPLRQVQTSADLKPIETSTTRFPFRRDWDARPRYESVEDGEAVFVGRRKILERLTSDFTSKRSGTILISGVRGVGKTALVERALLDARSELHNRYWQQALPMLEDAPFWRPIDRRVLRVLSNSVDATAKATARDDYYLTIKRAAAEHARRPLRFWQRLSPTNRCIRRMHEVSRSQLFVLKFNASDIGGAMAEPEQNAVSGRPNVSPEKLLRALIRKLFMTCHSSRPTDEARILSWSLSSKKKERKQFFDTLESAYNKSVSKSYKEVISNSINEAIKQSQSVTSERKITLERVLGLVGCLLIWGIASWFGLNQGRALIKWFTVGGGAALVASYLVWTVTSRKSRESTLDRARQAQFSYEFDYSLAQMEYDLQSIVRALHPPSNIAFDRYRCFARTVIVFDELDKLEEPVRQLNDVITHFKNFFTLSDALFVFITDHEFYEHLSLEGAKAQLRRHYSPEHTFFTQKLYLRKPDFKDFNETVYRFCDVRGLENRIQIKTLDAGLADFLMREKKALFETVGQWAQLDTLTHLYIHRKDYDGEDKARIEHAFDLRGGWKDPLALAQLWIALMAARTEDALHEKESVKTAFGNCGGWLHPVALAQIWVAMIAAGGDRNELELVKQSFGKAGGWVTPDAMAYLYHRKFRFASDDEQRRIQQRIEDRYRRFKDGATTKYTSVDAVPFTLTDLAGALCFQTRNHYFDLYYMIYDYVGSYALGDPVLHMEDERFTREHRLWSRYQQLVQLAFDHRKESHPSREYFNSLLMDSLYRVFDTRGSGSDVEVANILFSRERVAASLRSAAPSVEPEFALEGADGQPISTVTAREEEQINEAIEKLLRIAVARKAIQVDPELEDPLLKGQLSLDDISRATFTWQEDCEPVITQEGLDLEKYEEDLIRFWDNRKAELETLDQELEQAWLNVEMPKGSAARIMKTAYLDLRTKAEGLRRRSMTISQADASALKVNIGTSETSTERVVNLMLERIRAESDVDLVAWSNVKSGAMEPAIRSALEGRTILTQPMERLPVQHIILPRASNCVIYLVAGDVPSDVDLQSTAGALLQHEAFLFWYAPGTAPSEVISQPVADNQSPPNAPIPKLRFYFPPSPGVSDSLSKLLFDYGLLASSARLQQIAQKARDDSYRDKTAGLNAARELIAPLSGLTELVSLLSNPAVGMALNVLDEVQQLFKTSQPEEFWRSYGFEPDNWSQQEAANAIAKTSMVKLRGHRPPSDFQQVLERTILQSLSKEMPKTPAAGIFPSSDPYGVARSLLQELIGTFVNQRLEAMRISDPSFQEYVRKDFVPWLLKALQSIASNKNVAFNRISSVLPSWAGDLEKQRQALITTQLTQK